MFLRNAWYAGAWADELKPGEILARTILGEPLVFWRDAAGKVAAVEDQCCHRQYPLSKGKVVNGVLKCGYHGFEYDGSGACIHIPSQREIPANARVQPYPVVERHGVVFIWMGEAASADPATIPVLPTSDPQFGWKGTRFLVRGNYELIIENLLDLTHLTFVHASTIGNYALIENPAVKVERWEKAVQVSRWMINSDPPPTYLRAEKDGFKGRKVDRWQIIHWSLPSVVRLWTGAAPHEMNAREKIAAHGAPEGGKLEGIGMFNLNLITPETERSTHYFWAQGQDMRPNDAAMTELIFKQIDTAFSQDWEVFELQQLRMNENPGFQRVDVNGDAGGIQAINILRRAIEAEKQLRRVA